MKKLIARDLDFAFKGVPSTSPISMQVSRTVFRLAADEGCPDRWHSLDEPPEITRAHVNASHVTLANANNKQTPTRIQR